MIPFLKFLFRRHPMRIVVIHRDQSRLTIGEWRSQPEMVKKAMDMLANPDLRAMIDVLVTCSPANDVYPLDVTLDVRAVIHARCEGYAMALSNLESLGIWNEPKVEISETFEPPEKEPFSSE